MNLFFDLDIKYDGIYRQCTPDQQKVLATIWNYVYDRIAILIDEIEKEETDESVPKAIIIYLMSTPKAIQPRGYSDLLCDKINGCFTDKDSELLWQSVEAVLQSLWN